MNYQETDIGLIPSDWEYLELENYFDLITYGFTNPMPTTDEGPFMITAKDVNHGKILYNSARKTSIDAFNTLLTKKSKPEINDVLITKDGSIGRVAIVEKEDLCINQSVALIRPNEKIVPLFLKYLLESPIYQKLIKRDASGSTILHIYITRINKMSIGVPSVKEQKAIVDVIHSIQSKIENLEAQNKTLEQTAQTIFKEWFGKYQVGDELPDGWRVGKLGEISKLKSGYAFKSKDFIDNSSFKALKIKDLKGNGNVNISEVSSINEECTQIDRVQYFRLEQGDIVLAMSGNTTGKIGVVPPHSNEIYLNQRVGKFFLNNEEQKSFLYNFLMSGNFEDKILSMGYGSAQPNISPSQIESIDIIFPDNEKQIEYLNISNPIFDKVLMNNSQIQSLKKTRDTLLPKLMSGKIRVKL